MDRGGVHGQAVEARVHRRGAEAGRGHGLHADVQVDGRNDRQDRQVAADER